MGFDFNLGDDKCDAVSYAGMGNCIIALGLISFELVSQGCDSKSIWTNRDMKHLYYSMTII